MLVLNSQDVRRALPMNDAIEAMKRAFAALTAGKAELAPRAHVSIRRHKGTTLVMPALVDDGAAQALTVKVASVFEGNPAKGLPLINAAVIVLEPETGQPLALIEGATLTGIRTAAGSAAATDLLANKDSRTLAIFGAGVQARTHLEAICAVRPIETVWIFGRTPSRAEQLIDEMAALGAIPSDLRVASSPGAALAEANIVCTTTTATDAVFDDAALKPGVHINAVGSYRPDMREIPAATVARALVVVDDRRAAWEEAGDLIQPFEEGLIAGDHVHADLGELVLGRKAGRENSEQTTLFKSVGVAVQDSVAAALTLENAQQLGLGQEIAWPG